MSTKNRSPGAGSFFSVEKGAFASYNHRPCKIRRVLGVDAVVIQYLDTDETERVHPAHLLPIEKASTKGDAEQNPENPKSGYPLDEYLDSEWKEANRLYQDIIKPLLNLPSRTRKEVEKAAKQEGVSVASVYTWIKNYEEAGAVSGLIKGKRGRKKGTRLIDPEVDEIISDFLDNEDLDSQALTPKDVIDVINEKCIELGLKPPHANTIRNRIEDLPLKRRLQRRGHSEEAKQKTEARPNEFPDGNFPLACVQIDHVKINLKVVDAETREPIERRPWLTLAIDIYTRMIVGFYLSLDHPSSFGTGVALYMGMMPKENLLKKLDLPGKWPVFGKFEVVHADNAKEFKGGMMRRGCEEHAIDLQLRPVKTPHYGAHIERMVGKVNNELHKKLGTTHESPRVSPDYDSSKKSIYTLSELEREIVDWIVNFYHVKKHKTLETTPLRKWEVSILGSKKQPAFEICHRSPWIPECYFWFRLRIR